MTASFVPTRGGAADAERVLLVTRHAFFPADDGTAAVISLWYECLGALGFAIDVLSFDYVHQRWTEAGRARLARDGARLHLVPAYGRRAARGRLLTLAHAALRGHRFAPEWLRTDRATRARLDAVFRHPYALIAVHGVDAVHLAGPDRLRAHAAPVLLDIHDHVPDRTVALQRTLFALARTEGPAVLRRLPRSDLLQAIGWPSRRRLARAECRVARACDRILCSAPNEQDALQRAGIPAERLSATRWPVRTSPPPSPHDGAAPRFDFGFIGSAAPFNIEALFWFCREVWPAIRAARRDATCLVAGRAGEALRAVRPAARAGIEIAGWFDDVGTFYRDTRAVVVPLRSGTGVSVKTLEAAAHGAAIVATASGLRGLAFRDGVHVRRADTAPSFAAACLALAADPAGAAALGAAARDAALAHHGPADFTKALRHLIEPLRAASFRTDANRPARTPFDLRAAGTPSDPRAAGTPLDPRAAGAPRPPPEPRLNCTTVSRTGPVG